MALIDKIKCAKCDRKYSGLRSRCPYCGLRRIGIGKNPSGSDDITNKMLISILVIAVFTVSAGILLFSTPIDANASSGYQTPGGDSSSPGSIEEGTESVTGHFPDPTPVVQEEPDEPEILFDEIRVHSIYGRAKDITIKKGEQLFLNVVFYLQNVELDLDIDAVWESSDEDLFEVYRVDGGVEILGLAVTQYAELTVRVDDVEETVVVRVND